MKRRFSFRFVFFFCLAAALPALGGKCPVEPEPEHHAAIQVSGVVRLVGSEPFTEVVISGSENEWNIEADEEYKLRNLQHRRVVVEGVETVIAMRFASGIPAGERRTLSGIRIISVE